jgi:predicted transcriptional regulator
MTRPFNIASITVQQVILQLLKKKDVRRNSAGSTFQCKLLEKQQIKNLKKQQKSSSDELA